MPDNDDGYNKDQDGRPSKDFRLYRRGVWVHEEMMVHEENGIILGKIAVKRNVTVAPTEVKMSEVLAAGGGYTDPYPGEGF